MSNPRQIEFSIDELKKEIKCLNSKESCDFNWINNKIIKNSTDKFQNILPFLFNRCVLTGKMPDNWRRSEINMIPKKGDSSDPKSYRPISITSIFLRLFEKLLSRRMWKTSKHTKTYKQEQTNN